IAGYKQLIERAHLRGIKIIASPPMPFESALVGTSNQGYFTPEKEIKRLLVNEWIRKSGAFDGLIDFDRVVADPAHPSAISAAYDSGDHLHPNDAGYSDGRLDRLEAVSVTPERLSLPGMARLILERIPVNVEPGLSQPPRLVLGSAKLSGSPAQAGDD